MRITSTQGREEENLQRQLGRAQSKTFSATWECDMMSRDNLSHSGLADKAVISAAMKHSI